ncbi:MAG: histidinol dehydrogenase, partial [Aestuariivirga sp.]
MTTTYLKKATKTAASGDSDTHVTVRDMLQTIKEGREAAATEFARKLDGWDGDIIVSRKMIEAATKALSETVKDDIRFARDRICAFAAHQRDSVREFEVDLIDGLVAGQKVIPITTAGCYVPGGRYSHAASALMSVGTARVAGVQNVIAATPSQKDRGINPGILYAMDIAGADTIL